MDVIFRCLLALVVGLIGLAAWGVATSFADAQHPPPDRGVGG